MEKTFLDKINSAIAKGDIHKLDKLLYQTTLRISTKQEWENSPIVMLLESSKIDEKLKPEFLIKLIEKGADPLVEYRDEKSRINYSLIHYLLTDKNMNDRDPKVYNSLIRILIEQAPHLQDSFDNTGMTPISKAVELGDQDAVSILLKNGSDPNSCLWNEEGYTLIKQAIEDRNIPIIKTLVTHKDINLEPEDKIQLWQMGESDPSIRELIKKKYNNFSIQDLKIELLKKVFQNKDKAPLLRIG
jgi:hypothetical protein